VSPELGRGWVAGLDPAFSSDPFGLAIVGRDATTSGGQLVLGAARRWTPSPRKARSLDEARTIEDAVLDEVAVVCLSYGARVVTDQYRAAGVADYLRRKGLSVRTEPMTAASKTAAFKALRARLYLDGLELYDEPQLLAELRRLRTKYAAGQASVVNPRSGGSHGDIAQALALAVYEHDRHGMRIDDGED
jgi:phage terminase large subunit-like protein